MNIVLIEPHDWIDTTRIALSDRRFDHLLDVLGVTAGQTVRVGVINGQRGEGVVEAIDDDRVVLAVRLDADPPPRHPFDVVLALPRPKMLRRILRTCAEFGVGTVHLINSYRVEKSYWQTPLLRTGNIESALRSGLERSGDTLLPEVLLHHRFRPFAEDTLPLLLEGRSGLIAHPGNYPTLAADSGADAVVMIGPEGGFIPFELELALTAGMQPRAVGSRILSVDTALTTVLARELR